MYAVLLIIQKKSQSSDEKITDTRIEYDTTDQLIRIDGNVFLDDASCANIG